MKVRPNLEVAKLLNDGLMRQELNILRVIEGPDGCASLVSLLLVFRFVRIDTFQDTQTSAKSSLHTTMT